MFEFHGWVVLRVKIKGSLWGRSKTLEKLILRLKAYIKRHHLEEFVSFAYELNGMEGFAINGLRNHRDSEVLALFRWIAKHLPGSYGVLFIHNGQAERDCGESGSGDAQVAVSGHSY